MKASFSRLRSSFIFVILSMGLVISGQTLAQTSMLEYERAVLVSKFAKYVEWPVETQQAQFIIGVYKSIEKYDYFREFFANKGVKNKDILVRIVNTYDEAKAVNILYVPSNPRNLFKVLSGFPVLVITENSKDPYKTMIDFSSNKQESAIKFTINKGNITNTALIVPELSYFSNKTNNESVLSVSPTFALEIKKSEHLLALQNEILQQKGSLRQLNKKLNVSEEKSEKYQLALQKESKNLAIAQQSADKSSEEINAKDKKLQELEIKLNDQQSQLKMNKEDWQVLAEDKAKKQQQALVEVTEQLKNQKKITGNTVTKLADMTKDNKALSNFQLLFYILLIVAFITSIIAFMMWKKVKNAVSETTPNLENEHNKLLAIREQQLIKSENISALGYIATDVTYSVALTLADLLAEFESAKDTNNATTLKPVVTFLENFNHIAADQDDTEVQKFDVIAYMQKMMMLYDFEFNQSDIAYSYSGEKSLIIKSVPSYIALILLNLINNSLKHGFDNKGNGEIALNIESGAKAGVKITYSDNGKGMSESVLKQVFQPFFTTQNERGYIGVGMSTSYDLIKNKLTGDVKIESKEGKGTKVIITLS